MTVIKVTPRAKNAEKTMPIAASSLMGDRVLITDMAIVLKTPAIKAPTKILAPIIKAIANPGNTEWLIASPSKAKRCTIK